MSIHIDVPFEALSRPGVSKALAELLIHLGGHSESLAAVSAAAPAPIEAEKPEPVVSPYAAPKAASPYAAKAEPKAEPEPAKVEAEEPKAKPAKAKPAKAAAPVATEVMERWLKYLENLPENSKAFLALLEQRGRLSVDEAVKALNLSGPKAMGGLTGAMARWAPKAGVNLPFEAKTDENETRYWIWVGIK